MRPRVRSLSDQADRPAAAEERCRLAAREDSVAGFLRHKDRAGDKREEKERVSNTAREYRGV